MKMKFFILFATMLLSCGNTDRRASYASIAENENLIGSWLLVSSCKLHCNSCPSVEIFNDGRGKLIKPSKSEFMFNWTLANDKIKIVSDKSQAEDYIFSGDPEFYYSITEKNKLLFLELSSLNSSCKYILTKER